MSIERGQKPVVNHDNDVGQACLIAHSYSLVEPLDQEPTTHMDWDDLSSIPTDDEDPGPPNPPARKDDSNTCDQLFPPQDPPSVAPDGDRPNTDRGSGPDSGPFSCLDHKATTRSRIACRGVCFPMILLQNSRIAW